MQRLTYYQLLEIERSADEAAVKAAYRRLARAYHPDQNPDPDAPERFKAILEAYQVLRDPQARVAYDRFGHVPVGATYGTATVVFRRETPAEAVFRSVIRDVRRRMAAVRGADIQLDIRLTFAEAARGCRRVLRLPRNAAADPRMAFEEVAKDLEFAIPAGARDGQILFWRGQGAPGRFGGANGDLRLRLGVDADPLLRRDGNTVVGRLPLRLSELLGGTTVRVPTVDGPVTIQIPAGTRPGTRVRIPQAGVGAEEATRGDALFEIVWEWPAGEALALEALRAWESALGDAATPERAALDAATVPVSATSGRGQA